MQTLTSALAQLELGPVQSFQNLSAYPLLNPNHRPACYLTLNEAVKKGTAKVSEISEGGSVPQLLLDNHDDEHVLILDGEELLGAKQNRIANLSILAAAHSKTILPVSCVEHGRWDRQSHDFRVSDRAMFSRGRRAKSEALSSSLRATGTHNANQGEVWDNVAAKLHRMDVISETAAMGDAFDQHQERVNDYSRHFSAIENQVGVVFAIDGEVEGLDLFDATTTLSTMLPKLVRSFAIDALETSGNEAVVADALAATQFLDRLAAASVESFPGVGLGTDLRLSSPLVGGGSLEFDAALIHLAAFRNSQTDTNARQSAEEHTRLRSGRYSHMRRRNRNRDQ